MCSLLVGLYKAAPATDGPMTAALGEWDSLHTAVFKLRRRQVFRVASLLLSPNMNQTRIMMDNRRGTYPIEFEAKTDNIVKVLTFKSGTTIKVCLLIVLGPNAGFMSRIYRTELRPAVIFG